jgi:hypothetical protein
VDRPGVLSPPWTDANADRGHDAALTGEGNSARVSPELGRRCGGRATMMQNGEAGRSVRGLLRWGEREIGAGRGAVKLGEGACLL